MPPDGSEVQTEGEENLELEGGEIENESKITEKVRGRRKNLQEIPLESREVQVDGKENLRPGDESLKNTDVEIDGKDVANVTGTASMRVTRNRKSTANLELYCGEMVKESKITRKGGGRKKKLQEMALQGNEVQIVGKEIPEPWEISKNCEVQADAKEIWDQGKNQWRIVTFKLMVKKIQIQSKCGRL